MKSITTQQVMDVSFLSTRDRNDTAVVMQINFVELKSEINTSQRINASQGLKKVLI